MKDLYVEGICLVAVSGDCSEEGFNDTNERIEILDYHKDAVKDLMVAQAKWMTAHCFVDMKFTKDGDALPEYYALRKARNKLVDLGIFTNKWMCRTIWEVRNFNRVDGELQ